jgi:nucleoside-diphosphate-sugar epimerase
MQKQRWSAVVLGASGRVGRLILAEWAAHPPAGLQLRAQRRQGHPPDIIWELAAGADALAAAMGQIDVMVVLSGITPAPGADYGLNSDLAMAALQAAASTGVRHLFIASSAAVYGRSDLPIDETAAPAPLSDYGHAKLAMERSCSDWLATCPLPRPGVTFLRIGNVVGTDLFFRNLALASPDTPLRLDQFPDGTGPVRSYIGPASLARVLACLIRRAVAGEPLPLALNVGAAGGGVDMADFAPALLAQGLPAPVIRTPAPATALPSVRLSVDLLATLCPMDSAEGTAASMVNQWLTLRGATP